MDWSWIDSAVGAGLLLIGQGVGRVMQRRKTYTPKDPEPICGCDHHYSMHDPETGACHDSDQDWSQSKGGYYQKPCGCRRYTGPEPLPTYLP